MGVRVRVSVDAGVDARVGADVDASVDASVGGDAEVEERQAGVVCVHWGRADVADAAAAAAETNRRARAVNGMRRGGRRGCGGSVLQTS